MAAARLGYLVGPSWLVAELDKVVLPYHLDAAKQIAGRLALRFVDEMDDRVAAVVAERERVSAALRRARRSTSCPSGANFVLFRPHGDAGPRRVAGAARPRRPRPRLLAWPRLDGCLRVTIGTPDENDAFLAALAEVARCDDRMSRTATRSRDDQGDVDRGRARPRRHRRDRRVDRHPVLRPHARPARPPRRLRPHGPGRRATSTSTRHHTVEDVAIALGEAFREALGDKAGVRRFASGLYPLDEALVEVALDLSGRPFVVYDVDAARVPAARRPAVRPAAGRALLAVVRHRRRHHAARRRCGAGRNIHHIIEATFKGLARCLRDAVRVEGARRPVDQGRAVSRRPRPLVAVLDYGIGNLRSARRRCEHVRRRRPPHRRPAA